jgi:hypothetical protein
LWLASGCLLQKAPFPGRARDASALLQRATEWHVSLRHAEKPLYRRLEGCPKSVRGACRCRSWRRCTLSLRRSGRSEGGAALTKQRSPQHKLRRVTKLTELALVLSLSSKMDLQLFM